MAFVRVAGAKTLHAVGALVGRFASVPPPVLLVVGRMAELAVTVGAREARQVGVYEHVIVQAVLPCEYGTASSAFVRFYA